jgi:putative membrane protein
VIATVDAGVTYLWLKTLHVVAVVAWMSGLFYVGRIIVNHVEALARPEPARSILGEQLQGMGQRAYRGILTPGAALTVAFAVGMLAAQPALLGEGWLHAKLALVAALLGYHLYCGRLLRALAAGRAPVGSMGARVLNEVPTVFLVAIALLAVFKAQATPRALAQALGGLLLVLTLGILGYARRRARLAAAAAGANFAPTSNAAAR